MSTPLRCAQLPGVGRCSVHDDDPKVHHA
jgi:hypothetical protein